MGGFDYGKHLCLKEMVLAARLIGGLKGAEGGYGIGKVLDKGKGRDGRTFLW